MKMYKSIKLDRYCNANRLIKIFIVLGICFFVATSYTIRPLKVMAADNSSIHKTSIAESNTSVSSMPSDGELHAFYPSFAVFSKQIQKYIDDVDSLSFAWSRIDSEDFGALNTVKGKNGNLGFYYPDDFILPVEYAKSKGKSIQLNVYMDGSDCTELLPFEDKRTAMIKAIQDIMLADITQGKGIFYDGVVIDFEGLRNTAGDNTILEYEGKQISTYYTQFLVELKTQLTAMEKTLYVAVNPGLYYDGYDYSAILDVADRMILMAHDYEPTERLRRDQVEQYTGYDALEPISSMAPIPLVRQALNEIQNATSDKSELSKVWLQITFDSAQWQFDVRDAKEWENLDDSTLSREGRLTPLYKSIKARVDNTDGYGKNITYGYNKELQSPFLQYYNSSDKSWNIILYEDSNSISAKIELAKTYGLGGISLWSLANVVDYTDSKGEKFHLDGWSTVINEMNRFDELPTGSKEYVNFVDSFVEQAVRKKLGKLSGKISLADLKGIYRLKLSKGVKSLKDLKYLTNLEYLDSQQLGIKDITTIGSLKNLRVLYLQRNKISSIRALKKLTNLEVLSLNGNQISSISSLSALTRLQELYLRENNIASVTYLDKLTNLEVLEIGMNRIKKIDAIKNLKNLRQLAFDNNKITDIQALKSLTGLETLYLQRNLISNIQSLTTLKNLKNISLNGNKISDLKPISKLKSIEMLYLKDNKITTITPLKGLTHLKELYLGGNIISDYSPVRKLYSNDDFTCDFELQ